MTLRVVAILSGLLGFGVSDATEAEASSGSDSLRGPVIDVPFVAQGPLLCGGAAAAMVERFWGTRGVYGEDFAYLVRKEEGGIRTSELVSAMQDRGYVVRVSSHEPGQAFAALDEGIPPILLLESGATRLHYVVLVGMETETAWIHDPNFGPDREMDREELLRRWAASSYWTLVAAPADSRPEAGTTAGSSDARRSDVAAGSSLLVRAMERLRGGDMEGARRAARALLDREEPEARIGRRILATSLFLDGDRSHALSEWNALGEPTVDLIRIEGAQLTRYHVVVDRMSVTHGEILTPTKLALARRRLAHLPAVQVSFVEYRPVDNGSAEVHASLVERGKLPGRFGLAGKGIAGLVNHRIGLDLGPFMAAGDRWRAEGSWETAQRYVGASVTAPAPPLPGLATVGVELRRERFASGPSDDGGPTTTSTESRMRGALELQEWVHPHVRLGASAGLESWTMDPSIEPERLVTVGLAMHVTSDDDRSWLTLRGDGWTGAELSFGRGSMETGTTVPRGSRREWRLRAGATTVSPDGPRMVWPGAGSGRIREPLLRAHGLVEDGVIRGPAFGRTLLHATAEHRVFERVGPARLGASLFVDAAHARSRGGIAEDRTFVDVGAGVFLDLGHQEIAANLARGSSGWRMSARVGGRS